MKTLKKVILMVAIFLAVLIISNVSNAATVKVTGETLNVRKEASTSSDVIAMLSKDIECELLGEEGDFYKIKYNLRYLTNTNRCFKMYSTVISYKL